MPSALELILAGKIDQKEQNTEGHSIKRRNQKQEFVNCVTLHFLQKEHHILSGDGKNHVKGNNRNHQGAEKQTVSFRLRRLFRRMRLENICAAPSQLRHHLQDAPVELLLAFVSTPKLMKDHAILDEQDALTEAGGIGIMGYHQDRSLFVTIQAGQLLHKTSCVLRIQRTRRFIGKDHLGM